MRKIAALFIIFAILSTCSMRGMMLRMEMREPERVPQESFEKRADRIRAEKKARRRDDRFIQSMKSDLRNARGFIGWFPSHDDFNRAMHRAVDLEMNDYLRTYPKIHKYLKV